jgi:small subunit ribosomal protein S9
MKKTTKKVTKKSPVTKKTNVKRVEKKEKQKKTVAEVNIPKKETKKEVPKTNYIQAIGRRKSATCQLKLIKDSEEKNFLINGKDIKKYFPHFENQRIIFTPLQKTNFSTHNFYIEVKIKGGGKKVQSEAIRLALARALVKMDPSLRKTLKARGYLTCDARTKERKKFGLKKARKAPQWSKR